jgi:hypothetical protein
MKWHPPPLAPENKRVTTKPFKVHNPPASLSTEASSAKAEAFLRPSEGLGGRGLLSVLAANLFGDEKLKAALERGLTTTLKRTKDGATAESRVQELAGLVAQLSLINFEL